MGCKVGGTESDFISWTSMNRWAGPLLACALAWGNAHANAQAGATPPIAEHNETAQPAAPSGQQSSSAQPPTADDVCRTLEQAAAENALPVEFFARVIWQESRFNASAVSPKGAEGIAQFMPRTADWHGLADPFDPIEALRHSAGYLRELRNRFGNLGLAAAAYNAGPSRVSAWLASHRCRAKRATTWPSSPAGQRTNGRRRRRRKMPKPRSPQACPARGWPT
jgi:soluble lytic murein transglycosylase-like protein